MLACPLCVCKADICPAGRTTYMCRQHAMSDSRWASVATAQKWGIHKRAALLGISAHTYMRESSVRKYLCMRIVNIPYHVQSNQEMPDVMPSMDFKRVWRSASTAGARGARDTRVLSIWRPVGPPGYSSLGDVAVAGSEPPSGKPVKMYKDVMGAGDAPGQVGSSRHMG